MTNEEKIAILEEMLELENGTLSEATELLAIEEIIRRADSLIQDCW